MRIGIDIIDIDRIKDAVERTPRFLYRVFTNQEVEYCFSKSNPYPSLAARFAAKEAVRKLGPGFSSGVHFHDVEVIVHEDGRPDLLLYGTALESYREQFNTISISLSHSKNQAIAAVIVGKG